MPAATLNVSDPERVISAAGGGALFIYGLRRHDPAGIGLTALGQRCSTADSADIVMCGRLLRKRNKSRALFPFREPSPFQRSRGTRSSFGAIWRTFRGFAKSPSGKTLEWDTEIVRETKGRLIEWRSVSGAEIETSGSVRFSKRQNGRGTKVQELRKFKEVIEAT